MIVIVFVFFVQCFKKALNSRTTTTLNEQQVHYINSYADNTLSPT